MDWLTQLYRSVPCEGFPIGSDAVVVVSPELRAPQQLTVGAWSILTACQGGRLIQDHERAVSRLYPHAAAGQLSATIQELLLQGLLRPCSETRARQPTGQAHSRNEGITTFAIITSDRPAALERCLTSYVCNLRTHSRRVSILVLDDSRDRNNRVANDAIVSAAAAESGYDVRYVGHDHKEDLKNRLVRSGHSKAVLDFALPIAPPHFSPGANRNFLLLLTAGEQVLSVDDDTVCRTWMHRSSETGLALLGHDDPGDWEFFRSREDALAAARFAEIDLIGSHQAILGRTLDELVTSGPDVADLEHACTHMTAAVAAANSPHAVRLTFSGLAGHSGFHSVYRFLFSRGLLRAKLAADRALYDTAMSSLEVLRVVTRPSVIHERHCMTGCLAIDSRAMPPPFSTMGYNEDGAFGATVAFCDPEALFGHVPCGIVHDPARSGAVTQYLEHAGRMCAADVLIGVIRACTSVAKSPEARIRRLGAFFIDMAGMGTADFAGWLNKLVAETKAGPLARVILTERRNFEYPVHWLRALDDYREEVTRAMSRPDFAIPVEFRSIPQGSEARTRLQTCLRRFGEVLSAWPDLLETARHFRVGPPEGSPQRALKSPGR